MARERLTQKRVADLTARGARYDVTDARTPGFGVRVSPSGAKSYFLLYRPRGRGALRRVTLGSAHDLTCDDARRRATELRGRIAAGADPAREWATRREAPTVAEFADQYLDNAKGRLKASTLTEYRRLFAKHVLPSLGDRKVEDVTAPDVRRLHRSLRDSPYQANRVLAVTAAFFTFAEREGARPRHTNPAEDVEPYPEKGREREVTAEEYRRLGEALRTAETTGLSPAPTLRRKPAKPATAKHRPKSADTPKPANPYAVAAIRLLILTGAREGEVLSLRWDAVDLDRGVLRLAETKTGRSDRPLGQRAVELLAALPRVDGSPYVLPGADPASHLRELKRLWAAVRHAAGLNDLRLHDLRHGFASYGAASGESLYILGHAVGHRNASTTQKYAHLGHSPVKAAVDRISGDLAAMLEGKNTPVTRLTTARGRRAETRSAP